jgi:hypothetical protein
MPTQQEKDRRVTIAANASLAWREAEALVRDSRAATLDALLEPLEDARQMLALLGYPEAVSEMLKLRGTLRSIRSDLLSEAADLRAAVDTALSEQPGAAG